MTDLKETVLRNFVTKEVADDVKERISKTTVGVEFHVDLRSLCDDDKKRGVGKYAIITFDKLDNYQVSAVNRHIDRAVLMIAVTELHEKNSQHPLLKEWQFQKERSDQQSEYVEVIRPA